MTNPKDTDTLLEYGMREGWFKFDDKDNMTVEKWSSLTPDERLKLYDKVHIGLTDKGKLDDKLQNLWSQMGIEKNKLIEKFGSKDGKFFMELTDFGKQAQAIAYIIGNRKLFENKLNKELIAMKIGIFFLDKDEILDGVRRLNLETKKEKRTCHQGSDGWCYSCNAYHKFEDKK
jgi:hypothetical protein